MSRSSLLIPPLGRSSSPRFRLRASELEVRLPALERGDVGPQVGDLGVDVFDGTLELEALARTRPTMPCTLALGGRQVGFGRRDRGLLDRDLDLVGFLVELDQDASLFHAHVVVDQHGLHLAGDPRRHEGHVPVHIRIVGRNRVQCRLDGGDERVSSIREPAQDGQEEQSLSPGVRRLRGLGRLAAVFAGGWPHLRLRITAAQPCAIHRAVPMAKPRARGLAPLACVRKADQSRLPCVGPSKFADDGRWILTASIGSRRDSRPWWAVADDDRVTTVF